MKVQLGEEKVKRILADDGKPIKRRSGVFTEGYEHPAARAMLFGSGLSRENSNKAQIAIAHMGYEQNNCNMHLEGFAKTLKEEVNKSDLFFSWIFGIVGISDGITMGTPGMRSSLPSREWIADAIEGHVFAHPYDALVAIPGCDKNMPGSLIAMSRLNIPSIMVYGGTIRGGCHNDEALNIVSSFEAKGKFIKGLIDEKELVEVIENSCPGQGACGGMYTANTMSSAIEALGMSPPNSSSMPADSKEKQEELKQVPKYLEILLKKNIKPSDIMTKKAFENEIDAIDALKKGTIVAGDVVIIRNEGPKGAPGMPEMLDFTSAVMGAGLGKDLALITDGRFSGGSHGFVIGHVTPESYVGGPIALVKNGDKITIDAEKLTIDVDVSEEKMNKRKSEWTSPKPKYTKGLFAKIIRDMRQANEGAVTDI